MAHIAGHDRSQTLLLPESLDDYVGPDNPVRFMASMVATDVGPCAAVSMGTISLSQMSKSRSGRRRSWGIFPTGRTYRYAVAVLNSALEPAIAACGRWRPVNQGVLHWREVAGLNRWTSTARRRGPSMCSAEAFCAPRRRSN
jgi:hypothetical protein